MPGDRPPADELVEVAGDDGEPAALAETLHLGPKTVVNLHCAIGRKLEVDSDIELTRLAARVGLIAND